VRARPGPQEGGAYHPAVPPSVREWVPRPVRRVVWRGARPVLAPLTSLRGVRTSTPVVSLTFDDGPDPASTPAVLDALAHAGARATFFVLVERAVAHPGLLDRMLAEGHEVALHGTDHTRLTTLSPIGAYRHLRAGRRRLSALTGRPVRMHRPPHGAQRLTTVAAARLVGLRPVTWTLDAEDWADTTIDTVVQRVAANAGPGSIVVLHDSLVVTATDAPPPRYDRADLVAALLAELASRGLRCVTVSTLVGSGPVERTVWVRA